MPSPSTATKNVDAGRLKKCASRLRLVVGATTVNIRKTVRRISNLTIVFADVIRKGHHEHEGNLCAGRGLAKQSPVRRPLRLRSVPAAHCEFGRHNEPPGIQPDVQLPPILAFLRCLVLVRVPFAAAQNLEPVESTIKSIGPSWKRVGAGTAAIGLRRESVVWSGALRPSPIKRSRESWNTSIWRSGRLQTTRSVNSVRIASDPTALSIRFRFSHSLLGPSAFSPFVDYHP